MADEALATRTKTEIRREQILEAASTCVRREGFHGASMQQIAQAAALSVGQIYRYFANKEAIIAAIVAQDLAEMRAKFAAFESEPGPIVDALVRHCAEGIDRQFDPDRAALVLEVLAEAARNQEVACIVRNGDQQERALAMQLIERARKPGWTDANVAARAEILSALFEGLLIRGVNNPNADRAAMATVLQTVIQHIFETPKQ